MERVADGNGEDVSKHRCRLFKGDAVLPQRPWRYARAGVAGGGRPGLAGGRARLEAAWRSEASTQGQVAGGRILNAKFFWRLIPGSGYTLHQSKM